MNTYSNNNNNLCELPGLRFQPTDEQLVNYYLMKKVLDCTFSCMPIAEADLTKSEPWDLPGKAKMGETEWYFYNLLERKYHAGVKKNRATEAGYWKKTGADRGIYSSDRKLVGIKKTLAFYLGRAPKGEKSNWMVHEFCLANCCDNNNEVSIFFIIFWSGVGVSAPEAPFCGGVEGSFGYDGRQEGGFWGGLGASTEAPPAGVGVWAPEAPFCGGGIEGSLGYGWQEDDFWSGVGVSTPENAADNE